MDTQPSGFPSSDLESFPPLPGGFPSLPPQTSGRQPPGRGGKPLWVMAGRIYNYAKEGATQVASQQAAEAAVREFQSQGAVIDGLGAGGNRPQHSGGGCSDSLLFNTSNAMLSTQYYAEYCFCLTFHC